MREIHAVFSPGQTFVTVDSVWQYDSGCKLFFDGLDLPEYYEVHFSHTFTDLADVNIGDSTGVQIDDKFLRKHGYLYAWVYILEPDTGYTKCQVKIPIAERAQPPEDPPSQERKDEMAQAIDALNTQTGRAEAWAVGQRDGEDVPEGDETYHNNSKYWAEESQRFSQNSEQSATNSAASAQASEESKNSAQEIVRTAETNLDNLIREAGAEFSELTRRSEAAVESSEASAGRALDQANIATEKAAAASQSAQDANEDRVAAQEAQAQAAESATRSQQSEQASSQSEQNASGYADAANRSAQAAQEAAGNAYQSERNSAESETAARLSADAANDSALLAAQAEANSAANAELAAQHVYDISVSGTTLVVTEAQHGFTMSVVDKTVVITEA